MSIRDIIRNTIVTPAIDSGGNGGYTIAEVTAVSEKANNCTVKYRDAKDIVVTKENTPIRVYSNSFIDWFPSKGENVVIELMGGNPMVVGSVDTFSGTKSKGDNTLESDIYADDLSSSTEGGYIY